MNYSLFIIGFFLLLGILYIIIKIRDNGLPVVALDNFGPKSSNFQVNKKHNDKIIQHKIAHKNITFYAYLVSLAISFGLGCYSAIKLIQHMDFKLWQDALPFSVGMVSTISFKRFYDKCVKDLNNLP